MTNDNRVFINSDEIIEILVVGDQTVASVQAMGDQTFALAKQQQTSGRPVRIMDNLLQMGTVPAEARKLVVELVKSNDYDKLAMLGNNPILRFGANLILQATGKGTQVKYFDDRGACVKWLLS